MSGMQGDNITDADRKLFVSWLSLFICSSEFEIEFLWSLTGDRIIRSFCMLHFTDPSFCAVAAGFLRKQEWVGFFLFLKGSDSVW